MKLSTFRLCSVAMVALIASPLWGAARERASKVIDETRAGKSSVQSRTPLKRYRVVFNQDSQLGSQVATHSDLNKWIQDTFTSLENSDVGALFWHDGAGGNTANYDSRILELTGQRMGRVTPWLRRLIDEGNDPPKVAIREARKHGLDVFYSLRPNDVHDVSSPEQLPTFKVQHPEWLIGKQPYGLETALNFAIPEVRRIKFAVIEEIFQKYDFDGLEIDFLRSPPFFIPGEEPQHAHVLTQFLRDVRRHLDRRGKERGRPVRLAARVVSDLRLGRLDGFDVGAWMREGLVDYLMVGHGGTDVDVDGFKRLAKGTDVLIYACLYGWAAGYTPTPAELARGLALNYWWQGADGIYTFNWYPWEAGKTYQIGLLKEIGDPKKLRFKPVMFAADRGKPVNFSPHYCMDCVLPAKLAEGKVIEVPVLVGEDFAAASRERPLSGVGLRVECDNLAADDRLDIALNNKPVTTKRVDKSTLAIALTSEDVKLGKNYVTLRLARRDPQAKGYVMVKAVEIHADYQ